MNHRIGNERPSIFSLLKPTDAFWKMAQKQLPMKPITHSPTHIATICNPLRRLLSLRFCHPKNTIFPTLVLKALLGLLKG
jgi:hypothetical protein